MGVKNGGEKIGELAVGITGGYAEIPINRTSKGGKFPSILIKGVTKDCVEGVSQAIENKGGLSGRGKGLVIDAKGLGNFVSTALEVAKYFAITLNGVDREGKQISSREDVLDQLNLEIEARIEFLLRSVVQNIQKVYAQGGDVSSVDIVLGGPGVIERMKALE